MLQVAQLLMEEGVQVWEPNNENTIQEHADETEDPEDDKLEELKASQEYWRAHNPLPNIHMAMDEEFRIKFVVACLGDPTFGGIWTDGKSERNGWEPGYRYFKNEEGLLFFRDADYHAWLCVPKTHRNFVLREIHESTLETAHAGPKKLWKKLSSLYYWPWIKVDILLYCAHCDICQKIKTSNFTQYRYLMPNPIPTWPWESISMDFIIDLPWSDDYNAILVFVCRLAKQGLFIPTTTGLDAEGFACLFVKHVACKFGLPTSIILDWDPRWMSDFWRAVTKFLRTRMALSLLYHLQHDGQTEILNCQLEVIYMCTLWETKLGGQNGYPFWNLLTTVTCMPQLEVILRLPAIKPKWLLAWKCPARREIILNRAGASSRILGDYADA